MEYDLTRLGSREFEHLTQALAVKILGAGVGVFGAGPDGGREATYQGRSAIGPATGQEWEGYHVVQAKFRERPVGNPDDGRWFVQQVREELKRWADPASARRRDGRLPAYLILATNVALSARTGGGIDTVEELIGKFAPTLGLRGWVVWHHDALCRLLDDAPGIRSTYAHMITAGDVLGRIRDRLRVDDATSDRIEWSGTTTVDGALQPSGARTPDDSDAGGRPEPSAALGPLCIDRWRHTLDGMSSVLVQAQHNQMPGIQAMPAGQDPAGSVRFGILLACGPLAKDAPTTTEVRARFRRFLADSTGDYVTSVTAVAPNDTWQSHPGHGRTSLEAVLTRGGSEPAVASARLNLPQPGLRLAMHDPRCAEFILHIEPRAVDGSPAPPIPLRAWPERLVTALLLPGRLVAFLEKDLGLRCHSDPAAQIGIWLSGARSVGDLVDVTGCDVLPGAAMANWFSGYAIADPSGDQGAAAAREVLRQLCDYTLHLDDYESMLGGEG